MASSSLLLPELKFLAPQITPKRRLSLSRLCSCCSVSGNSRYSVSLRMRIRAAKEEGALIEETRESELAERVSDVKWSGNGVVGASVVSEQGGNGSVKSYVNGRLGENGVGNGSLVKYVNGNGVAAGVVEDFAEASERREDGRKKRLEEIGKEDAWFKQSEKAQVDVAAAPGGRWSRFKTYSTIQRTLEIWGFVLTFIFKAWLNNQKFSYRGLLYGIYRL